MTTSQRNLLWLAGSLTFLFIFLVGGVVLFAAVFKSAPIRNVVAQISGTSASQTERNRLYALTEIHGTKPDMDDLAAPFRAEADGKPIDVEVGHAAPLLADFDGNGKSALLVGQFGSGKLRIYANEGSATQPRFAAPRWFDGTVPTG